jgi:hypothetical protein
MLEAEDYDCRSYFVFHCILNIGSVFGATFSCYNEEVLWNICVLIFTWLYDIKNQIIKCTVWQKVLKN